MEVASIHFPFKRVELDGLLYRTPDRKIQSSSSCFASGDPSMSRSCRSLNSHVDAGLSVGHVHNLPGLVSSPCNVMPGSCYRLTVFSEEIPGLRFPH